MRTIKILITALLFLLITLAQTVNVKIVETTDVHGNILPYDFMNNKDINYSLAHVSTYLKKARAESDVILLDNGDILQGTPFIYYSNFEKPKTLNYYAKAMNYLNYDAATVGNHDIETGHPVYDKFKKEIRFPWLAANAVNVKTGKPYFKPYTIIKRDKIKIAVLGLITPHIPNWLPEKIWKGMKFEDMIETAKKWIPVIQKKEKPDMIVGLFHAGVDYSYGEQSADQPLNENASLLVAERVSGLDIVFVGHDHRSWNFTVKNPEGKEVLILGSINAAKQIATADVKFEYNKETKSWDKTIKGNLINTTEFEADKEFIARFNTEVEEAKEYITRPIASFTKTISSRESIFGNSAFMDLIHQFQLDETKADISFTAPFSPNDVINEGVIKVSDMFKLYKYENLLYTMSLTGKEIKGYLEFSFGNWFNTMKDENDHLIKFKENKDNKRPQTVVAMYNYCSAAGINYTVDVSKQPGDRVKITGLTNGQPFDLNKTYKVAINSYRGNGGGGHLTTGSGIKREDLPARVINTSIKDLRFIMMKWLEKKKMITPQAFGNWKVIPEDWWLKGKEKDKEFLFAK